MIYLKTALIYLILISTMIGCKSISVKEDLNSDINKIIKGKKLDIGVSVRDDSGKEVVTINNNKKYKLYSVSKYFLGIYILHLVDKGELNLDQKITFSKDDLRPNLYSPLRDKMPQGTTLSLKESLMYLLQESDNNVFDKLTDISGGLAGLNSFICKIASCHDNFFIKSLYRDPDGTIGYNVTTPGMASYILNKINNEKVLSDKSSKLLKEYMANSTNHKRIQGIIADKTKSFHRSGTSDRINGVRLVTNDIGVVNLSNGKSFSIAVLISNSEEDDTTNDYVIAKITDIVYSKLNK